MDLKKNNLHWRLDLVSLIYYGAVFIEWLILEPQMVVQIVFVSLSNVHFSEKKKSHTTNIKLHVCTQLLSF